MDKTDISLILSTLCALDVFFGRIAALVIAAFLIGIVFEQHRRPNPPRAGR
jgi:hypothetical protein